jgi:hypothetical protein
MPISAILIKFRRRIKPNVLAATTCCLSTIVFVSFGLTRKSAALPEPKSPKVAVVGAEQNRTTLVESEVVTITRRGFEPVSITRPEGRFILMIENPNWQLLNLRLSREAGQSLKEVRASRQEPNWNDILDLQPGRYLLTEQNHPEWTCLIIITAR